MTRPATLAVAALMLCATAQSASAADTVIGFDDLADSTFVTGQYHAQGVDFSLGSAGQPRVRSVGSGVAHSGDRVLDFSGCGGEFCDFQPTLIGRFPAGSPRTRVKVWVGDVAASLETREVRLSAYDAGGLLLAQAGPVSVTSGAGFATALEIVRPTAEIARLEVSGPAGTARLAVDDVTFDALTSPPPPLPAPPTLMISSPTAGQEFPRPPAPLHVTGTASAPGGVAAFCVAGPGHQPGIPPACAQTAAVQPDGRFDATLGGLTTGLNFVSAWVRDGAGQVAHQEVVIQVASGARLSVNGIDVNQAIQSADIAARDVAEPNAAVPYEGVTLAAGHRTVARVYANAIPEAGHPSVTGVAALLYGCRGGSPLPGGPLSPEGGLRNLGFGFPGVSFSGERTSPTGAYTFTLPESWTAAGPIRLKAQIFEATGGLFGARQPPAATCKAAGGSDSATFELKDVRFVPTRGFSIHPIALNVSGQSIPDPAAVFDRIRAITPTAEGDARLPLVQGFTEYFPGDPPRWKYLGHETTYEGWVDISDLAADLAAGRRSRKETNTAVLDRLVRYVNDGGCGLGCGSVVVGVTGGTVDGLARHRCGNIFSEVFDSSCPNDAPTVAVNFNRPLTSVAHELYHGLGRVHASKACGGGSDGQVGEDWPPDGVGYLQGVGIDPRPRSGAATGAPYRIIADPPPARTGFTPKPGTVKGHWYDFMSYCASGGTAGTDGVRDFDSWTSTRGWETTLRGLRTDCRRVGGLVQVCPGDPGFASAATRRAITARAAAATRGLRVLASDDGASARMTEVGPLIAAPPPPDPAGVYHLVARSSPGAVLSDTVMAADRSHVEGLGELTMLSGQTPALNAARLEVVRSGTVIASRERSAHAPVVRVFSPRAGATAGRHGTVEIAWRASDADSDLLTATVDYSHDGGRTFKPVFSGRSSGRARLPSGLLSSSRRARVRVRVSDGFAQSTARSGLFTAIGGPPAARITSPARDARLAADATLAATGEGWDDRQSRLTGRALTWWEGRHRLGSGERLSITGLRPGRRTLRLVARDRSGRVTADSVSIRVLAVRPLFIQLTAPRAVSARARRVALRVASSVPATLRVGRRRFAVGRRARDVAVPVRPGRARLGLDLRLVAGSRSSAARLAITRR